MRIGYLVSEYPALSHTFIRREIEALRLQDVPLSVFSIRRPAIADSVTDQRAVQETDYILPLQLGSFLAAHALAVACHPVKYLKAITLALRHRVPGLRSLIWSIFYFAEAIFLARKLRDKRIEHLHSHFANAGATVGFLASRFLAIPWSLTLHGISETDYPAGVLLGRKIEAATFVACATYFGRAQAMRAVSPDCWDKLIIVRCALDLAALPKARSKPSSRPRLIAVGRLSPEKGYGGLLQAFAAVRSRGLDAELIIVGEGPERDFIEHTIRTLGLQTAVTLRGGLSEEATLAEIASAHALVLASLMEGLPVVLMEALALGVPVIASRVAGVPELVIDGKNGLLFSPTDWDELSRKIEQLLGDSALRERLGQAGPEKIKETFEINMAVQPLAERFNTTCRANQDLNQCDRF